MMPKVNVTEMSADMLALYSLTVTDAVQLESYDDCMYRVTVTGEVWIIKRYLYFAPNISTLYGTHFLK